MGNKLAKKFTFGSLFSFALPNVIMMMCLSMYIIVDGIFVSRILGTTSLSSVNMVYPAICLEMALAIMIATGGSAIVARKLGEGRIEEAQKNFSFLLLVEIVLGLVIAVVGSLFVHQIIRLLGANPAQEALAIPYARIIFAFAPAFFLQTAFQTFFVTAGKPTFGLVVTLLAGVTNLILDYLFMVPFEMGMVGAALATGLGYSIPAIVGLVYFLVAKKNPLHFVRPTFSKKVLFQSCSNGSSEMVVNLANAVTTFLFNYTLLKFYGEDGVAAITILLYFQYIFTALYFGYSNGIAPIISFKYGSGDRAQMKSIFKYSMLFLLISTVLFNLLLHFSAPSILTIFTSANSGVYKIALYGFSLYSLAFIFMGVGIFASAFFTALSDGKSSAIISLARTFLFIVGAILILPNLFGKVGVFIAVPIAELLGLVTALVFLFRKKKIYGYLD